MKQYFLKFQDEQESKEVLEQYVSKNQWLDEQPVGTWITDGKDHVLNIVGTISKPTGETLTDSEGMEYPAMVPLEGFHVNLGVGSLPTELETYRTNPETPDRLFAGMEVG
jgi:hypothetical protein